MERMKQENTQLISFQTERDSLTATLLGLHSHLSGERENRRRYITFKVLTNKKSLFNTSLVHRFGEGVGGGSDSQRVSENWKANGCSETSDRQHLPQVSTKTHGARRSHVTKRTTDMWNTRPSADTIYLSCTIFLLTPEQLLPAHPFN